MVQNKKVDLRVLKTKKQLKKSLLILLKTDSIDKISITDICTKAKVNRGTFYSHYHSQFDLLQEINLDLYNTIKKNIESNINNPNRTLYSILVTLKNEQELSRVAFEQSVFISLINDIIEYAISKGILGWNFPNRDFFRFAKEFYVGGIIYIIKNWIKNDFKDDISKIVDNIIKLSNILKEDVYRSLTSDKSMD